MPEHSSQWTQVAAVGDVPPGEAKAVKLGQGRGIALFNVDGRIYATDNQCPHMGYPLWMYFDSLRSDPRYSNLMSRIGLPY